MAEGCPGCMEKASFPSVFTGHSKLDNNGSAWAKHKETEGYLPWPCSIIPTLNYNKQMLKQSQTCSD